METEGIEISHPDKVYFPNDAITKKEVVEYYHRISSYILPWLEDRPLTLQRFPDGIGEEGFYQKNANEYFPEFIERVHIKTKEGYNDQVICNSVKDLIYLVNQGVICFHIWQSKKDKLEKPDRIVFDLDPPEGSFDQVKEAAEIVGTYLRGKNIKPQLMTTGKSGLHVFFARRRTQTFAQVRETVSTFAESLSQEHPNLLTTEIRKEKRKGRIFVDYLRNAYAQTAVCPYSLRPVDRATVATPIDWQELGNLTSSRQYDLKNIFKRLAHK